MTALDHLLADTGHVDDPTPHAVAAAHLRLDRAVAVRDDARRPDARRPDAHRPDAHRPGAGATRARLRHWRVGLVAVGAAAVVLVTPALVFHGGGSASSAAAATVLRQAGRASVDQQTGWPDAAYWHSVSSYSWAGHTYRREVWIGHHAPSVLRDPGVGPGLIPLGTWSFDAGAASLTWDQLYALPTDPSELKATLVADIHGAGNGTDAELFVIVGDLLRESPAPPLLREALYDMAADIPGVRLVGQVTDPAGRTGTAVERDDQEYIIDVDDGRLLDDIDGGSDITYLMQGPASSAPTQ